MRRRGVIAGLGGVAAWPLSARAQQARKTPIIGFLPPGLQALGSVTMDALLRDMGKVHLIYGQPVRVEERWAGGEPGRVLTLAKELVALDPMVIIAVARPAIEAVRLVSKTVPIVANDLENDPLAAGYAASLSRPGGNVTGVFLDAPAICGKWLQQITEVVPNLRRLSVLWDSGTGPYQRDAFRTAARAISLEATVIEFRGGAPIESVLETGLTSDTQAVVQLGSPLVQQSGGKIAAVMARHRLPGISPFRTFPVGGGLMSYGVDLVDLYRRIVPFVAKVLHGARPGDIPIEQPVKFELVINLKTAKTFGLAIPPTLLAVADEVIE
jgi:putative ABC transport system substrate-binding protein